MTNDASFKNDAQSEFVALDATETGEAPAAPILEETALTVTGAQLSAADKPRRKTAATNSGRKTAAAKHKKSKAVEEQYDGEFAELLQVQELVALTAAMAKSELISEIDAARDYDIQGLQAITVKIVGNLSDRIRAIGAFKEERAKTYYAQSINDLMLTTTDLAKIADLHAQHILAERDITDAVKKEIRVRQKSAAAEIGKIHVAACSEIIKIAEDAKILEGATPKDLEKWFQEKRAFVRDSWANIKATAKHQMQQRANEMSDEIFEKFGKGTLPQVDVGSTEDLNKFFPTLFRLGPESTITDMANGAAVEVTKKIGTKTPSAAVPDDETAIKKFKEVLGEEQLTTLRVLADRISRGDDSDASPNERTGFQNGADFRFTIFPAETTETPVTAAPIYISIRKMSDDRAHVVLHLDGVKDIEYVEGQKTPPLPQKSHGLISLFGSGRKTISRQTVELSDEARDQARAEWQRLTGQNIIARISDFAKQRRYISASVPQGFAGASPGEITPR